MQCPLEGRVAVVTGGSGDLGLAMAQALADAGASIVLASRDLKRLESARARMSVDDAHIWTRPVDVTDATQVRSLMEATLVRFKRLDILVNAAGIQLRKSAMELTPEEWNRVLNVNLSGTFYCCQAAARSMLQTRSGRIIMISSLTAEIGIPKIAPYVASKGPSVSSQKRLLSSGHLRHHGQLHRSRPFQDEYDRGCLLGRFDQRKLSQIDPHGAGRGTCRPRRHYRLSRL